MDAALQKKLYSWEHFGIQTTTQSPTQQLDGQTPNHRHADVCDDMQEKKKSANKNANLKQLFLTLI